MLCGEFYRAPLGLQLSFSDTRSPYSSLLALVQGMAAITAHAAHDDEDIFLGKSIHSDNISDQPVNNPQTSSLSDLFLLYFFDMLEIDPDKRDMAITT